MALFNRLRSLWEKLVEPADSVRGEEARYQARLLASVLATMLPLGFVLTTLPWLLEPGNALHSLSFLTALSMGGIWLVAYYLNRRGRTSLAGGLLIAATEIGISLTIIDNHHFHEMNFYLIPVVISGLLFSNQTTRNLVGINILGILLSPMYFTDLTVVDILINPLGFVVIGSALIYFFNYHRDWLENYRQAELIASQTRFELVMEGARDGLWDWDLVNNTVYYSPRWKAILGFEEQEIGSDPNVLLELIHPDDYDRVVNGLLNRLEDHAPSFTIEYRMRHKDGGYRWIHTRGQIATNEKGKPCRVAGSHTDVTHRRETEDALQRQAMDLYTMLEASQTISSTRNIDQVLKQIGFHIANALAVDGCAISRWDEEAEALITWVDCRRDSVEPDPPGTVYPLKDLPVTRAMIETGEPLVFHRDDPEIDPHELALMEKLDIASLMMIPLIYGEETIGLLELDTSQAREFTPDDLRLCQGLAEQAAVAIENVRLYEETQRQLKEQTILREVGETLASTVDQDALFTRILQQVCEAVDATSAYISSYSPDTYLSVTLAEYIGPNANPSEVESDLGVEYKEDPDNFWENMRAGRSVVYHHDDTHLTDVDLIEMAQYGAKSILAIPLSSKGESVGIIEVWESRVRREFTPEEIALCGSIARQAAVAIDNLRLYEQTQQEIQERTKAEEALTRQARELSTMLEASRAISSTMQFQERLLLIAKHMTDAVGASGCTLSRWDREADGVITLIETRLAMDEDSVEPGTIFYLDDYPATRKVLEDRETMTIYLSDPDADPAETALLQEHEAASLLMLPLIYGDQVAGLVEIDREGEREFTVEDIRLCQGLAEQAAVAFENARLYEETQRQLREQTILRGVGEDLTSTLDQEALLSRIARQFNDAVGATSAYICIFDDETRYSSVASEYISPQAHELEQQSDLGVQYFEEAQEDEFLAMMKTGQHLVDQVDNPALIEEDRAHMIQFGAKSILFIPLSVKGESIGFVEVWESRERREFTLEEIALCHSIAQQASVALDNARLYEQTQQEVQERKEAETALQRQTRELSTLLKTSQAITSTLQIEETLELIASHISEAMEVDGCIIFRWDQENDAIVTLVDHLRGSYNWGSEIEPVYYLEKFPSTRAVLETGMHAIFHRDDPEVDPEELASMEADKTATMLMVPLIYGDQVIGLVEMNTTQKRDFTLDEIRFCQGLTEQASVAIENARLHDETQSQLRAETILREVGEALTSTLDQESLLNHLARLFNEAIGTTSAFICTYETETQTSTVLAEYVSPLDQDMEKISYIGDEYHEADIKYWEQMVAGKHFVEHFDDDDLAEEDRAQMAQYGGKSILYIPLSVKGESIGYVELWETRERREFTPEEIDLCHSIARQAAVALDNVRLFEQAQQEIEERKRVEELLRHDAFHDKLTGLPNRALLTERLERTLVRTRRHPQYRFSVLFLDLDNFKNVNDSLGHTIGDKLLVQFADRLNGCVREVDTVARLGGDEFVILLEDIEDLHHPTIVAERILESLNHPFQLSENEIYSSTSIGIVVGAIEYYYPEEVLSDADIAMYRAKDLGRGRYEIFDRSMREKILERLTLERQLRRVIEREELVLHYQPIHALADGEISGFEALVRWKHAQNGLIFPGEFIPIAEDTGLILKIGRWVLHTACSQTQEWQERFPQNPALTISVNLSGRQLVQPDLVEEVQQILQETGLRASSLNIEITENAVITELEKVIVTLEQLRAIGVGVQLDDFGTGYSSLNYLHQLPIDGIKIDRSFITQVSAENKKPSLTQSIITMGHELGLTIIAEGIESEEQIVRLKALGADYGQGYHFSRPVEAEGVEELLGGTV